MLGCCWASVADVGPTAAQHWFNVACLQKRRCLKPSLIRGEGPQQRREIEHVLIQCWPIVSDAGPTLKQHKGNVTCLLGGCSWCQSQCYYGVTDLIVCIHLRLTLPLSQQRAIVVICSAHVTANSQYQMLSEIGHHRDVGPALKQHWIKVTCVLV